MSADLDGPGSNRIAESALDYGILCHINGNAYFAKHVTAFIQPALCELKSINEAGSRMGQVAGISRGDCDLHTITNVCFATDAENN